MCVSTVTFFQSITVNLHVLRSLSTSPSPRQGELPAHTLPLSVDHRLFNAVFVISQSCNVIGASTLFHFVADMKTHIVFSPAL